MKTRILNVFHWFLNLSLLKKAIAIVILLVLGWLVWTRVIFSTSNQPTYQTAQVTRDTLVVSLTESGQVAVANRMNIVTQASGVVSEVFVKNGDTVAQGDKIATVTLDQAGQLRQSQAYTSYLSAESSLAQANSNMFSLQGTMFTAWNTFTNLATNSTYQNSDGSPNTANRALTQFTTAQDTWLASQANYQNQQTVVSQAQSNLSSTSMNLAETSSTITTPIAGVVSDLTMAPGMQITNTSSASTTGSSNTGNSTSGSTTNIASIKTDGQPVITVNLSEIDATQIQSGQRATIILDSLPNQTFTGKVLGVNTTGVVSSGVTTYPATIILDTGSPKILPNMGASASIITNVVDNTLLVPVAAVQTANGSSTVRVMKNGAVSAVPVEIGLSSDTQTQIISGLTEGQTVITGSTTQAATTTGTTSPFGGGGIGGLRVGGGGFGGGGGGGGRGAAARPGN